MKAPDASPELLGYRAQLFVFSLITFCSKYLPVYKISMPGVGELEFSKEGRAVVVGAFAVFATYSVMCMALTLARDLLREKRSHDLVLQDFEVKSLVPGGLPAPDEIQTPKTDALYAFCEKSVYFLGFLFPILFGAIVAFTCHKDMLKFMNSIFGPI